MELGFLIRFSLRGMESRNSILLLWIMVDTMLFRSRELREHLLIFEKMVVIFPWNWLEAIRRNSWVDEVSTKLHCQRDVYRIGWPLKAMSRLSKPVSPGNISIRSSTSDVTTENNGQEIISRKAKPENQRQESAFSERRQSFRELNQTAGQTQCLTLLLHPCLSGSYSCLNHNYWWISKSLFPNESLCYNYYFSCLNLCIGYMKIDSI